jgi:hypothetical protein
MGSNLMSKQVVDQDAVLAEGTILRCARQTDANNGEPMTSAQNCVGV